MQCMGMRKKTNTMENNTMINPTAWPSKIPTAHREEIFESFQMWVSRFVHGDMFAVTIDENGDVDGNCMVSLVEEGMDAVWKTFQKITDMEYLDVVKNHVIYCVLDSDFKVFVVDMSSNLEHYLPVSRNLFVNFCIWAGLENSIIEGAVSLNDAEEIGDCVVRLEDSSQWMRVS